MDVKLKVLAGSNAGAELPIPAPKFFIGRAEDCQLRPKSDMISRHHCVLMIESDAVVVRDLGSRNGTFVNNERVSGETPLKHGDRLRVGPLEFELHCAERTPAKKRPKVNNIREALARTAEGTPGATDLDVNQWMTEPAIDEAETRELPAGDPGVGGTRTTVISVSDLNVDTDASSTEVKPATPPPLVKPKTPPSADSGKAAADVLRNFFKRR